MNPLIAFNTIQHQFVYHRNSLMKLEYDINAGADAIVYVQLHDIQTPAMLAAGTFIPPDGSVPLKSWPAFTGAADNYKEFKNGEMSFANGIFVCISTTQATLTLGTGNNKFDSVAVETWEADITNTTTAQATAANSVAVWSEAAGATNNFKLIRGACTNLEAGVRYLMLFANNAATGGSVPIAQWTLAPTGTVGDSILVDFGTGVNGLPLGLFVRSKDPITMANKQGCTLAFSTTPGTYTGSLGAKANFFAEYKLEA